MTASRSYRMGDLIGVRVSSGSGDFPDLVSEQIVALGALDPHHVSTLLSAADAAAFFTREEPCSRHIGSDVRTWHIRLSRGGKARLLAFPEPVADLATKVLIQLACSYLSARRAVGIEEVSEALRDAVAASRVPSESAALNHETEPDAGR